MEDFNLDLDLDSADLKSVNFSTSQPRQSIPNSAFDITPRSSSPNNYVVNREGRNSPITPHLTVIDSTTSSVPTRPTDTKEVDFGLNLLANRKKQRSNSTDDTTNNTPMRNNNIHTASRSMNNNDDNMSNFFGMSSTQPDPVNTAELLSDSLFESNLENIDLDNELNNKDTNEGMTGPSFPDLDSKQTSQSFSGSTPNFGMAPEYQPTKSMSYEDTQKAKFDLLCKFERLRDKGVRIPKTFSMSSDYEEMKYEYERLVYQRKMENSVKMQRQMLISFVTGAEFLNGKFDPFDLKLDNWSEHIHENINDYDDIFEELYDKYKDSASMAPELRLMFMLGGSAFMYHLSNTMFKSALPGVGDIMKQNPDLMKQFTQAAVNTMGQQSPGFAGFMGNVMNNGGSGGGKSEVPPYNPMSSPPFANPSEPPPRETRPEMSPPPDIDGLLASISGSTDLGNEREISFNM